MFKKVYYHFSNIELFNFFATDGVDLDGILFWPEEKKNSTKTAWIHVHGMNDFATSERFLDKVRDVALKNKTAFFNFGNRGMGHINVFRKFEKKTVKYLHIGTSLERFEHCIYDIDGAINHLKSLGFENFMLSGHSTGCQKIMHYQSKKNNPAVKAVILLSPVDDVTFDIKELGKKFKPAFSLAKKLVKSGRGNEILPFKYSHEYWSAHRFYSIYKLNSVEGDLLNYTKPLKTLKKIKCPILSIIAAKEQFLAEPAEMMMEKINAMTVNKFSRGVVLYKGDHCFDGADIEFEKSIHNWVKKLKTQELV